MRTPKLALVMVLAAVAGLNCDDDKTSGADAGTGGSAATGGTGGSTGGSGTGGTGGSATGGTGGGTGGTAGGTGGATGGTGGTAGTGGTSGTGGTGTGGTGGMPASCEIPCLTNLIANCVAMGTCQSQSTLLPTPMTNQCYSNGVKISSTINISGGGGTVVGTYSKMGMVCYSVEVSGSAGSNVTLSYKNPAGTVVGTATYDNTTMKTTFTCTGSAMTYDLSSAACSNIPQGTGMGGADAGAGSCPAGTCP